MSWAELLHHIQISDGCSEKEARKQAAEAIGDGNLHPMWIDSASPPPSTSNAIVPPWMAPSDDYWMNLCINPADTDCVIEPEPAAPLAKEGLPSDYWQRGWEYST